jgi:hypothetical protein
MLSQSTVLRLCAAFPAAIESDVRAALGRMPACDVEPTEGDIGPVRINGEHLRIPHRIYSAEPYSVNIIGLSRQQRLILNALYSRHHDGHVREKNVRVLIDAEEPWLPPFVIQMLGEYVVEIVQVLELHLVRLFREPYIRFLAENEPFFSLVSSRLVSYWDCYYRSQFPRLKDYPPFRIADLLRLRVRESLRDAAAEQALAADSPVRGLIRRIAWASR